VSAERALQRAAIELSLFLRDARGEAILPSDARLPDDLPDVSPLSPATIADDIRSAPARRPELRRLNAQRAQFEVDRDLARNQMLPAVDVVVSASQDIGAGSSTRSSPEVDASLLLDVPILNRPARGRLEVARANLSRLDEQLRFQRDRILADLRDARSAVDAALQRAELAALELSVARQVEAAERTNFDLGNSTILAVNLREQASAEAASREVDARADFHRAIAAYLAAAARR
jgi:outer membrane protein TolC